MQRISQPSAWPRVLLALLALGTLIGFFVYRTYPNYDSLYSLIWGKDLLHGHLPVFEVYRGPTEHPLAIAFGAVMSIFGTEGDRLMVGATLASFVALAAGLYRLGAVAYSPLVGVIAGALLLSRFDFPFLAARGYIDIPYLALVVWAAALETERRRRGLPVFVLLGLASMMRPEAWLLIGAYWLWYVWPKSVTWAERIKWALVAAIGPVVWAVTDLVVTGDPLFSLHSTSELAEELGRASGLGAVPNATWAFLKNMDKAPVLVLGLVGLLIAIYLVPRRLGLPALLLGIGLATFGLVGVAGLSIIDRYLLIPALMLMIYAGVALGGWTLLEPGRARTIWRAGFGVAVVGAIVYTIMNLNLIRFTNELRFREHYRADLQQILRDPKVKASLKCGPLSTPNHKLVPDIRWLTGLDENQVLARSDPKNRTKIRRGVALVVTDRYAILRQAYVSPLDAASTQVPPPGFGLAATTAYYGAYVRCPR